MKRPVILLTVVGALVAYGRLPSIVVTLGMLSILRGGLVSVTGGQWISDLPPAFQLAQARLLGVPAPITEVMHAIVHDGAPAKDAMQRLMQRSLRSERD